MSYKDETLWKYLENKINLTESKLPVHTKHSYLAGIEHICNYGIERALTIRDSFPMYTLHDETHICNVLHIMANLLGDKIQQLSRDEAAILILSACCHDIGMSYSDEEKASILEDSYRINKYLEENCGEYVRAYAGGKDKPDMTDDIIQNYLRSVHHERVGELLYEIDWPEILEGKVDREELIRVCQSHGRHVSTLDELDALPALDLRFCAILLRLADILDFDTSRAPQAVYNYCGFDKKKDNNARISKKEWKKHMASHGFDFDNVTESAYPYILNYHATSKTIQIEQAINTYLDWVDQELTDCNRQLRRFAGTWQDFVLPMKIKRNIRAEGYLSGQYRLTLDHSRILELFAGKELYNSPTVFVRELLQNAIDAVRTREQLDKNLPAGWHPQINIRTWIENGFRWFRIEDNGTGMTEDIIMNYLLKVGCSYYTSDLFEQDKIRCKANPDFTPISQFGIGILSCFMGDERTNQIEISTKRFNDGKGHHSALRMSMHGMVGYYYLASQEKGHHPGPMKGKTQEEKTPFLRQAGTVIAVRTGLYLGKKHKGFKDIIDQYIFYPQVAIHYDGEEGSFDYPTESELMEDIHNIQQSDDIDQSGCYMIPIPEEQIQKIKRDIPELSDWQASPVKIKCVPLDHYAKSPYLTGAALLIDIKERRKHFEGYFGCKKGSFYLELDPYLDRKTDELHLNLKIDIPYYPNITEDIAILRKKQNASFQPEPSCLDKTEAARNKHLWTSKEEIACILNKYEKYDEYIKGRDLIIYKLSDFDWYNKYFKNLYDKGQEKKVSYNGIICGDVDFFFHTSSSYYGIILLLKDKFRPQISISRQDMQWATLEMFIMIESMFYRIGSLIEVFDFPDSNDRIFNEFQFQYYPAQKYWDVMHVNESMLENKYVYSYNGGWQSPETIQQALDRGEAFEIYVLYWPVYFTDSIGDMHRLSLSNFVDIAYYRKKYLLRIKFDGSYIRTFIIQKGCDMSNEQANILPPYFFILPLDKDCPYLTTKEYKARFACNANHRFSKFILDNCIVLNDRVPELLWEMLHSVFEDQYELIIKKVNNVLKYLQEISNDLFNITNDIYLIEDDFI